MVKSNFLIFSFLLLISLLAPGTSFSQEKSVIVERCKALDQTSPIHNIWVDDENIKWVANTQGLHKLLALDIVEKVSVPAGTTSLLMIRGGNAQIEWNTSQMDALLGGVKISCAAYDAKNKTVWLGTRDAGAFQVSVNPLKVVQRLHTGNKLTSDQINDIYIHTNGTVYIATNDGMLTGSGDRWTLQERYLNFIAVDAWGDNLWILGDDFLWQVDNRGKWSPIAIELKNVEGQMRDITVDDEGRVWIASNMMTGYDVNAEKYQRFGPGQYFTSQFVNCLDVDKDGSIWTGTQDKGLYLIQWESSLILTINNDVPLDCNAPQPTAALTVKVAGGKPPYTFLWNNGQTAARITNLAAGDYKVTVSDASGLSKEGKYTIADPKINLTVQVLSPSSGVADASAMVTATGGSGQYIYAWDNQENIQNAIKLGPGAHVVTVTDKSGCSATASVTIAEDLAPLTVAITKVKDNLCAGAKEGELRADAKGGKGPYRFAWSSQNGTTSTLSSLAAGTYTVSVTDAAGNIQSATEVLALPVSVNAIAEVLKPAAVNSTDGQAQVRTTGGKAPYTFKWDNGETTAINKSLSPGLHSVTVTDANGCNAISEVNVSENVTAMFASIRSAREIKCYDVSSAVLIAEVTGGKGPYQYQWSNGQKGNENQNIKAGEYQVTITDVLGSFATANYSVPQPSPVSVTLQVDGAASVNNDDGRATAKASGGTGIFDFAWDNGEKSNKAVKLSAGTHTVTVTDGNGCTAIGQLEMSENILALQVALEQKSEILCADATALIEAIVAGGKEPYTYRWNNQASAKTVEGAKEGLYTLTVTDAVGHTATSALTVDAPLPLKVTVTPESAAATNASNGRASVTVTGGKEKYSYQWDNGEKTARAEKLTGGNHSVTVTDNNGCTATGSVVVSENITPLAVVLHPDDEVKCVGDATASLRAEVFGGKPPYTYQWKNKDGKEWSTESIHNLEAGLYAFKVSDATGAYKALSLEVKDPEPLKIEAADISPASTGNADGTLTLKITGGKFPYTYNGSSLGSTTNTVKISKLAVGEHTFLVSDANGCHAETKATISENVAPLAASINQMNPILCAGAAQASVEAIVKGGKAPFAYQWSNGHSGSSVSNLAAGDYSVVVTDASGQKSNATIKISSPPEMTVSALNLRSATNDRISDGKGNVEVKGGTGPYKYQWSSGETTAHASKLPLGSGSVIVTDQNGCSARAEFNINEKVLPELTAERLSSGEPIRMEKIQFEADSVKIEPEAIPSLNELYEFLYDNPTVIIEVAGHTNGLPADEYCDLMSSARAKSVADFLINKGIESRRVISKGYGKRKPIASNQTPEGRKRNQRVEIRLIKIEE